MTRVYLNVYDLTPGNDSVYWLGLGAYHSGVEISGEEWSFGQIDEPGMTGVFSVPPRGAPQCQFRLAIDCGETQKSSREIDSILDRMRDEYMGRQYSLVSKNCNHFSADLLNRLGCATPPPWINRLAFIGSLFKCVLPEEMGGDQSLFTPPPHPHGVAPGPTPHMMMIPGPATAPSSAHLPSADRQQVLQQTLSRLEREQQHEQQ